MPGKYFDFDLNLDYYDDGDSINKNARGNNFAEEILIPANITYCFIIDPVKSGESGWYW